MILHSTVLDNGLRIVVHEMSQARTVSAGIWVEQGSRHEPPEANGITHLVEHLLFDIKAPGSPFAALATQLEDAGARWNATTTKDYTEFHITALPERLDLCFRALVDIVQNRPSPPALDKQRAIVLRELEMFLSSTDQIYERLDQALWGRSSLGLMILGEAEILQRLDTGTIHGFIESRYGPDDSVLVVAGQVKHAHVFRAAEKRFRDWQGRTPLRAEPPLHYENDIKILKNRSDQVTIGLGVNGVSHFSKDRPAVEVLVRILGHGTGARLYQEIREKRGLAYAVGSYANCYKPAGVIAVGAQCHRDQVREVLNIMLYELAALRCEAVTPTELRQAQTLLRTSLYADLENTATVMKILGRHAAMGEMFSPSAYLRRCDLVSPEDITSVAQRLFRKKHLALAALGNVDAETVLPALDVRGW